jgi:hypothetical protein
MIDDMEAGTIGGCWAWRSDRLVRDTEVALSMVQFFARNRVRLWLGFREIDVTSADGLYNLTIEAAANRRQRDRASEDVIRDKEYRAEFGLFTRDPSCYGWRSGGKDSQKAIPQWNEIAVAEMMMRWFVVGDERGPLNLNQIAIRMMDLGIPLSVGARGHKVRDAKIVTYAQVRAVISNPMFVAKWRHGDQEWDFWDKLSVSKDGEPKRTAVPQELFDEVKARLEEVERPGLANDRTERLCSGLAVCALCGMPMHTNVKAFKSGDKLQRFYCAHRTGRRKTCIEDGYASLVVDEVDAWVRKHLAPMMSEQLRSMSSEVGGEPLRKELNLAERKLADARKKESESLAAIIGVLDSEQIASVATQLRAERQKSERACQDIRDRLSKIEGVAAPDPASLGSVALPRLREALRRAVRFIAVGEGGVTVLTRSGDYIVAPLIERDLTVYSEADNRRRISPVAVKGDSSGIPYPHTFLRGRRRSLGKAADRLADDQLLP